mmetsp:Transcript_33288/g.91100  ORF Transcript_33288/g.91100 Transcript_33288/m.91100 type:complete len:223 (-) Transcript_33288:593-1261(-)
MWHGMLTTRSDLHARRARDLRAAATPCPCRPDVSTTPQLIPSTMLPVMEALTHSQSPQTPTSLGSAPSPRKPHRPLERWASRAHLPQRRRTGPTCVILANARSAATGHGAMQRRAPARQGGERASAPNLERARTTAGTSAPGASRAHDMDKVVGALALPHGDHAADAREALAQRDGLRHALVGVWAVERPLHSRLEVMQYLQAGVGLDGVAGRGRHRHLNLG